VVARFVEVVLAAHAGPPVDRADEKIHAWLQLANHLPEIVPTVAVENGQFLHALAGQSRCNVGENRELGARVHVESKLEIELARVHAKGNGGKHNHLRPLVPGNLRRALGDRRRLEVVGGIGEMKVVWLRRTPGEDCDFVVCVLDRFPVGFGENVWSWWHQ